MKHIWLVVLAAWIAMLVISIAPASNDCTTDTECMQLGGDGGPE